MRQALTASTSSKHQFRDIQKWFLSLSLTERISVLAIEDKDEVRLIHNMYTKKREKGPENGKGSFTGIFLAVGESEPELPHIHHSKLKRDLYMKKMSKIKVSDFLFRKNQKSDIKVQYPEEDLRLESSIRFSDSKEYCDTITISSDLLKDGIRFIDTLDKITGGKFMGDPCYVGWNEKLKQWQWGKPSWFGRLVRYTLSTYVASRLAMTVWKNYWNYTGMDPRLPGVERKRSLPLKLRRKKLVELEVLRSKNHITNIWESVDFEKRDDILNSIMIGMVKNGRSTSEKASKEHSLPVLTEKYCRALTQLLQRICEEQDSEHFSRTSLKRQATLSNQSGEPSSSSVSKIASSNIPARFLCPQTNMIFLDPKRLVDGKLYEGEAITGRVIEGELHPKFMESSKILAKLKLDIKSYLEQHPDKKQFQYKPKGKTKVREGILLAEKLGALSVSSSSDCRIISQEERKEIEIRTMLRECNRVKKENFIEYLFFTSLPRFNTPFDKALRWMRIKIQQACANKMKMDLIMDEEIERNQKDDKDRRKRAKNREKRMRRMKAKSIDCKRSGQISEVEIRESVKANKNPVSKNLNNVNVHAVPQRKVKAAVQQKMSMHQTTMNANEFRSGAASTAIINHPRNIGNGDNFPAGDHADMKIVTSKKKKRKKKKKTVAKHAINNNMNVSGHDSILSRNDKGGKQKPHATKDDSQIDSSSKIHFTVLSERSKCAHEAKKDASTAKSTRSSLLQQQPPPKVGPDSKLADLQLKNSNDSPAAGARNSTCAAAAAAATTTTTTAIVSNFNDDDQPHHNNCSSTQRSSNHSTTSATTTAHQRHPSKQQPKKKKLASSKPPPSPDPPQALDHSSRKRSQKFLKAAIESSSLSSSSSSRVTTATKQSLD
mmetsp:Transcript_43783/g.72722  ORF Transcript_43783/g.72722 Transcript_43783/m.72722 type:complete len:888 (+) Transcript_43783:168-2831(+)